MLGNMFKVRCNRFGMQDNFVTKWFGVAEEENLHAVTTLLNRLGGKVVLLEVPSRSHCIEEENL